MSMSKGNCPTYIEKRPKASPLSLAKLPEPYSVCSNQSSGMKKNCTTVANRSWPISMVTLRRSAWWMNPASPRAATRRWVWDGNGMATREKWITAWWECI